MFDPSAQFSERTCKYERIQQFQWQRRRLWIHFWIAASHVVDNATDHISDTVAIFIVVAEYSLYARRDY